MELGIFGKLPSAGDFVLRNLSPQLKDGLDALIQAGLGLAIENGMSREYFAASSPVAVNIRPGSLVPTGFIGVLLPSNDKVGRIFPLCIGYEVPAGNEVSDLPSATSLDWPSATVVRELCKVAWAGFDKNQSPDEMLANCVDAAQKLQHLPLTEGVIAVGDDTVPPMVRNQTNFVLHGKPAEFQLPARNLLAQLPGVAELVGYKFSAVGEPIEYFGVRSLLGWSPLAALFDDRWAFWGWSEHGGAAVSAAAAAPVPESHDEDRTRPSRQGGSGAL